MYVRNAKILTVLIALSSVGISRAANNQQDSADKINPHEEHAGEVQLPTQGIVILRPTKENKVRGNLRLIQEADNLHVRGQVRNLTPGLHGFHIHEFGDLRSADGTSAGGHFAPYGHQHGKPGSNSHVGDLGNIRADDNGVAKVNIVVQNVPLHFLLGRAFVVHAGEDDLQSQPSGAAGPRVAVGVIGVANPEIKRVRPNRQN